MIALLGTVLGALASIGLPWVAAASAGSGIVAMLLGTSRLKTIGRMFSAHRSWLVLLGVAAAGAALYAWGAGGRADRDRLSGWADKLCAVAGAELAPPKSARGTACYVAVRDLAAFRADAATATAAALAQAETERADRSDADARTARRAADAARTATASMEAANGRVTDDRIGSDWLAAFNRVAGLSRE